MNLYDALVRSYAQRSTNVLFAFADGNVNSLSFNQDSAKSTGETISWTAGASGNEVAFNTTGYQPVMGVSQAIYLLSIVKPALRADGLMWSCCFNFGQNPHLLHIHNHLGCKQPYSIPERTGNIPWPSIVGHHLEYRSIL